MKKKFLKTGSVHFFIWLRDVDYKWNGKNDKLGAFEMRCWRRVANNLELDRKSHEWSIGWKNIRIYYYKSRFYECVFDEYYTQKTEFYNDFFF